jgi:hypothetical protein
MDGLEDVSKLVARYAVAEDMFLDNDTSEWASYRKAILGLYEVVLEFEARAAHHFYRSTATRMISNIGTTVDWADLRAKIRNRDNECRAIQGLLSQKQISSKVDSRDEKDRLIREEIFSKLKSLDDGLRTWRQKDEDRHQYLTQMIEKWRVEMEVSKKDAISTWVENMVQDKQSCLEANAKIVAWISNVQVGEAHARVREKLGSQYWNTGQWFLSPLGDKPDPYKAWRESRQGQIWIQGSPGTGKSSLESLVIHDLIKNPASEFLAFYCFRTVTDSSNTPLAVLRSLVAQLACSNDGMDIVEEIQLRYQRESAQFVTGAKLSIDESVDLLIELVNSRGSTAIVIDALDECSAPNRLLTQLRKVWNSTDGLKIFFTSRLYVEVTAPSAFPDAVIVRSGSGSDSTSEDINSFIRKELEHEGRRNVDVITEELAERMVKILTQRAQGMYV